jgi:hypothetical protein
VHCPKNGGSPLEANAVTDALTQNIKTATGKPEHLRPQPLIQWTEPAALQGPRPENVPEETFIAKT